MVKHTNIITKIAAIILALLMLIGMTSCQNKDDVSPITGTCKANAKKFKVYDQFSDEQYQRELGFNYLDISERIKGLPESKTITLGDKKIDLTLIDSTLGAYNRYDSYKVNYSENEISFFHNTNSILSINQYENTGEILPEYTGFDDQAKFEEYMKTVYGMLVNDDYEKTFKYYNSIDCVYSSELFVEDKLNNACSISGYMYITREDIGEYKVFYLKIKFDENKNVEHISVNWRPQLPEKVFSVTCEQAANILLEERYNNGDYTIEVEDGLYVIKNDKKKITINSITYVVMYGQVFVEVDLDDEYIDGGNCSTNAYIYPAGDKIKVPF